MKRFLVLFLSITMLLCFFGCSDNTKNIQQTSTPTDSTPTDGATAVTPTDNTDIHVTVAVNGLNLAYQPVTLTDADNDGKLTLNDAVFSAHEQYYEGGATAGYSAVKTEYGLSLYKLWGEENGGSYGYFINDTSAMSLYDEVKAGDEVYVYAYQDTTSFSDSYSFFDKKTVTVKEGEIFELTLSSVSFDENWSPVTSTVAGAVITVDGTELKTLTDENGKASVSLSAGNYILSAVSASPVLTPAVCLVTVTG